MPNYPTWDGLDLFGEGVVITAIPNPVDIQIQAFGGVNGLDMLLMGSRGHVLHVTGVLWAATLPDLMAVIQTWRAYRDVRPGVVGYTVVDNADWTWNYCLIKSFPLLDRILADYADPTQSGLADFAIPYQAEILAPAPPIAPS